MKKTADITPDAELQADFRKNKPAGKPVKEHFLNTLMPRRGESDNDCFLRHFTSVMMRNDYIEDNGIIWFKFNHRWVSCRFQRHDSYMDFYIQIYAVPAS